MINWTHVCSNPICKAKYSRPVDRCRISKCRCKVIPLPKEKDDK